MGRAKYIHDYASAPTHWPRTQTHQKGKGGTGLYPLATCFVLNTSFSGIPHVAGIFAAYIREEK